MKWSITLVAATAMFLGGQGAPGGDRTPLQKQLQFNLRVFAGDPLGSREAGTLKVVAEPRIITFEKRSFSFVSGDEITVTGSDGVQIIQAGRVLEGRPGTVEDGKVRLDVLLSNTTVGKRTKEYTQLHTETSRTITTARLGEVVKFRWGKGSADKQVWAELSVEEVKP